MPMAVFMPFGFFEIYRLISCYIPMAIFRGVVLLILSLIFAEALHADMLAAGALKFEGLAA